jgi:hypothetical protein
MSTTFVTPSQCNFRVVFRYGQKATHYKYFTTYEDASLTTDEMKRFEMGALYPSVYYPTSKQIQKKGPRGGWSKV